MRKILTAILALAIACFARGQATQLIGSANVSGTMTFQSGSNLTLSAGSGMTVNLTGYGNNKLLGLTSVGGSVGVIGLGAGISISGGNLVAASSTSANPSATVGTSAVNGSAATFMTSDSAPALNLTISPTWTGIHSFQPTSVITVGSDYGVEIIPILNERNATNFSALLINEWITQAGTGNQYLIEGATSNGSGGSKTDVFTVTNLGAVTTGIWQATAVASGYGGTGLSTFVEGAILTASAANTWSALSPGATTYSVVTSNGTGAAPTYYPVSTLLDDAIGSTRGAILERASGGWTAFAPGTTGYALVAQGAGNDPQWVNIGGLGSANPTATIGLSAVNGTAATFMTSDSAPPLSQAIVPTWTGLHDFAISDVSSSGNAHYGMEITATVNQTSTAGFTDLYINRTQTAAGSGTQRLISANVGGVNKFYVDNSGDIDVVGTSTLTGQVIYGSASGGVTSTTANAGTNATVAQWINTSGTLNVGVEQSSGGLYFTGDAGYAGIMRSAGQLAIGTASGGSSVLVFTANTLALTLDTSQNATFAGEHVGAVHYQGTSGTPTYTISAAAGSTATCSVVGNDTAGLITLTVAGTGITSSASYLTIIFSTAYNTAPAGVVLQPATSTTLGYNYDDFYLSAITTAHFVLGCAAGITGNTTLEWYYHVN